MRRRDFIATALAFGLTATAARAGEPVVTDVTEGGLVGKFFAWPADAPNGKRRPAILMLGGSGGGYPDLKAAQAMAGAGHPVLALAYFRGFTGASLTTLPAQLKDIPLEYFFKAIDWMKTRPEVNAKKIVLMGESRGGELVLELASRRPDVAGVIAYVPSHLRWGAVGGEGAGWTLGGQPLGYMRDDWKQGEAMVNGFIRALDKASPADIAPASIEVEKIRGKVLLFSTSADQIWPSTRMANAAMARMAAKGKRGARDHIVFSDSSHLLMGPGPGITHYGEGAYRIDFGGTAEGTRKAREEAWARSMNFIDRV